MSATTVTDGYSSCIEEKYTLNFDYKYRLSVLIFTHTVLKIQYSLHPVRIRQKLMTAMTVTILGFSLEALALFVFEFE